MCTGPLLIAGFHCEGSCWKEQGGPEGLIQHLESVSIEYRDWFAGAEWARAAPTVLALPPAHLIHPIQDFLVEETVQAYVDNASHNGSENEWDRYPTLFTWQGKTYVFQGTHRLAAARRLGHETYRGYHIVVPDLPKQA